MARHFELRLKVAYDISEVPNISSGVLAAQVRGLLLDIADRAAAEGLMSGDTALMVEDWSASVEEITKQ